MKPSIFNIKRVLVVILLFPFFSWNTIAAEPVVNDVVQPVTSGSVLQMLVGLVLVIALIFIVGWLIRRISGFSVYSHAHLKVISGLHVGQKEKVLLIQVADKQILLGVTPYSIHTLHELPASIENTNSTDSSELSFSDRLLKAMRKDT